MLHVRKREHRWSLSRGTAYRTVRRAMTPCNTPAIGSLIKTQVRDARSPNVPNNELDLDEPASRCDLSRPRNVSASRGGHHAKAA